MRPVIGGDFAQSLGVPVAQPFTTSSFMPSGFENTTEAAASSNSRIGSVLAYAEEARSAAIAKREAIVIGQAREAESA